jgi:DNA-directed RNA polymerase subunit alpha
MAKKSLSDINLFGKTLPELSQIEALTLTVNSAEFARARFHVEIEEYAEKNPKDMNLRCGIGYSICGKHDKAIAELEQAPDDGLKLFYYGRTLKALGRYNEAVEMFRKAGAELKDPTIAELERISSLIYGRRLDEANSSLKSLDKVLKGKSADYHYQLAKLNETLGDYDTAIDNYEKAIGIDEHHVESMFAIAFMLDLHGNDNLALEYYKASTQINPLHISSLLNMAVIYEDNEDYENAMNCINIVLRHHPNHKRGRLFKKDVQSAMTMFIDEDQEKKKHSRSRILEKPITDYELSVRSRNCLKKMNINTVGDLLQINESELLSYKNFGETSLTEIRSILEAEGLRLGMYHDEFLANETQHSELSEEENAMLRKPIADLELSVRARRAIDKLGIRTLGDVVSKTEAELLACKNFGITSLTEIKERLCKFNLKLRKID